MSLLEYFRFSHRGANSIAKLVIESFIRRNIQKWHWNDGRRVGVKVRNTKLSILEDNGYVCSK